MFKHVFYSLLKAITTLVNSTTKNWTVLAKKASPKVLDTVLIVLTIAMMVELFWFTALVTFWLFWRMLIVA